MPALAHAIQGVELHRASWSHAHELVAARLRQEGISASDAETLARAWLLQGDFLLAELDGAFDVVIGNPPYVRQELIADALMAEYRARYGTIYDRADIYVPFIERSLSLLAPGGRCGFICSDRWMKNRYGGPLRAFVANGFHLRAYVDMVNTPASTPMWWPIRPSRSSPARRPVPPALRTVPRSTGRASGISRPR